MIVVFGCGYKGFRYQKQIIFDCVLRDAWRLNSAKFKFSSLMRHNAACLPLVKRITVGDDNLLPC